MKILVTGPDGFVGKALVARLENAGHHVVKAGRMQVGDIENAPWDDILPGVEGIVHLAARVHQMKDTSVDPLASFRAVNRDATLRLAVAAERYGVKRFIFLSSVKAAIDRTDNDGVDETVSLMPESPYGISKLEAELGLLALPEVGPVILRPPLIYGPGAKGNFLSLAKLIGRGIPLPIGGIHNRRSFLGLGNLVTAIEAALIAPGIEGQVFYIADDQAISTKELVLKLGKALSKNPRIIIINYRLLARICKLFSKGEIMERLAGSLVIRNNKFKRATGWKPNIPMAEELARFTAELHQDL